MRQFAIIGLGTFGSTAAKTLSAKKQEVLAIDADENKVQDLSASVAHAVCLDATDVKALKAVGAANVDVAIISVGGNIEASILIALLLKELGIKEIIAKAVTAEQGKVLEKVGVNRLVFPEKDKAVRLATALSSPKVADHLELSSSCSIIEIAPPKQFIGKTLGQLNMRAAYGVNVVAVKRKDRTGQESVNAVPSADEEIKPGDMLLIAGPNEAVDALGRIE